LVVSAQDRKAHRYVLRGVSILSNIEYSFDHLPEHVSEQINCIRVCKK
jgi:hypothetical protein